MDNILTANKNQRRLLKNIGGLGCAAFVMTGIIGCNTIESGGTTFGWIFTIAGLLLYFYMNGRVYDLEMRGGALTSRKLSEYDLKGLSNYDLEILRCHIYAKYGYKFNVNDGLCYLEKIAASFTVEEKQDKIEYGSSINCSQHQFLMAIKGYRYLQSQNGHVQLMTEKDKDWLREFIERESSWNSGCGPAQIGNFNRDGEYGHEGQYYYYFRNCDWYKPSTNNICEVYSKMSDIEKYNVNFICNYISGMEQ